MRRAWTPRLRTRSVSRTASTSLRLVNRVIGQYVVLKGQRDLLEKLQKDEALAANASMQQGFTEMGLLFTYLEAFGAAHTVSFDLSLARGMSCPGAELASVGVFCDRPAHSCDNSGLDYYTGVIYEVVTEGSAPKVSASADSKEKPSKKKGGKSGDPDEDRSDDPTVGIGSVAAGGRFVLLDYLYPSIYTDPI